MAQRRFALSASSPACQQIQCLLAWPLVRTPEEDTECKPLTLARPSKRLDARTRCKRQLKLRQEEKKQWLLLYSCFDREDCLDANVFAPSLTAVISDRQLLLTDLAWRVNSLCPRSECSQRIREPRPFHQTTWENAVCSRLRKIQDSYQKFRYLCHGFYKLGPVPMPAWSEPAILDDRGRDMFKSLDFSYGTGDWEQSMQMLGKAFSQVVVGAEMMVLLDAMAFHASYHQARGCEIFEHARPFYEEAIRCLSHAKNRLSTLTLTNCRWRALRAYIASQLCVVHCRMADKDPSVHERKMYLHAATQERQEVLCLLQSHCQLDENLEAEMWYSVGRMLQEEASTEDERVQALRHFKKAQGIWIGLKLDRMAEHCEWRGRQVISILATH